MVAVVALANSRLPVNSMKSLVVSDCHGQLTWVAPHRAGPHHPTDHGQPTECSYYVVSERLRRTYDSGTAIGFIGLSGQTIKAFRQWVLSLTATTETMERLLIAMLWIGTALLTLAILTGLLFLDDMFAQRVAHHTVLTTLSWCVFMLVFCSAHHIFGWRGVSAVRWNLSAFGLLLLGYVGSKFVLEYLLQT